MDTNDILKQIKNLTDNNDKSESEKKTLTSLDFTPNNGEFIGAARENAKRAYSVDEDLAKKYNRKGLVWTPKDYYSGSLDTQLADAQSNWAKAGNAIAQTVVSEVLLGTALGINDLFDLIGKAIGVSDKNYQNPVSRTLEEWQDKFNNDVAPIYSRPGSGFENGTDFGWWMQNIPSIMSSLTLLVPAAGGTKAVSLAGKGLSKIGTKVATKAAETTRLAGKTKKAEQWVRRARKLESGNILNQSSRNFERTKLFLENGMTAALSRTLENYQEARQVYNDMYSEVAQSLKGMTDDQYATFIDRNKNTIGNIDTLNKDEVAKAVAKQSADVTFKANYANIGFDIIQLYALRNIGFSGFRKSKASASARRLDINSRRFAGKYKTMAELEELVANQSLKRKAADKVGDFLYTGRTVFLAEASEGVEEAVNYIAQQEGMYVGHTMLGMEANSAFSDRLNQYIKNPELWESAFWGVAGGIVFQGAGSGLARARTAIERKNEAKNKKPNDKTGEDVNANTSWKALWEQGDVKRIKMSIENRLAIENKYQEDMQQIRDGHNPYVANTDITSDEEREMLAQRALQNRRTTMVLNAMDSGTIDMLKSYLQDDNIKQAFIDNGLVTKEQADKVQEDDVAAIERIQQLYDKNVRLVDTASRYLNIDKGINIPLEYVQIIARNNIESELAIQDYEEQLKQWEAEANELGQAFRDKLDPNIDHKEIIRLNWLTRKLGELEADKRELLKNKEVVNSISGQERLRTLNKNINTIRQMVTELNPDNKLANLMFAIENSFAYEKIKNDYEAIGISSDYLAFRKAATERNYDYFKKLDERLIDISEQDFGAHKVLDQNVRRALSTKETNSISNVSKELGNAYATLAALQYYIATERTKMNITEAEVEQEAGHLHNYMNEVRKQNIKDSTETIKSLADTYGADLIRSFVISRYYGKDIDLSNSNLTDQDKDRLINALDTLNLSEEINSNIAEAIDVILKNYDDIKAAQEAARHREQGESSSTSQNLILDGQQLEPINPSSSTQNINSGQNSGQIGQNMPQNSNQNGTKPNIRNGLDITNIGNEVNVTNNGNYTYKATDNPDQFEVKFLDASINNEHFRNSELFDQEKGVSIMDENFIIGRNPIIDRNGNVVQKGLLVLDNDENNKIVQREEAAIEEKPTPSGQSSIFSTGGLKQTPTPTPSPERVAEIKPEEEPSSDEPVAQVPYNENDIIDKANKAVMDALVTARKKGSAIDWNGIQEKLNKELQTEGQNSDYIANEIQRAINWGKNKAEKKGIKSIDAALDVVIRSSVIREGMPKDAEARKEFAKAVAELLKVFNAEVGYETIDGKQYINVEALCRYCDKVLDDKMSAKFLADNLVSLVKEDKNLIYTDTNVDAIKEHLVNPIDKTFKQDYLGIDYNSVLRSVIKSNNQNKINELFNIIDKLQPGDKINVEYDKGGMTFSVDGVTIGSLPYPNVSSKNGALYQYNDGWRTDILNHNNNIVSELKDLFIKWATDTKNADVRELNELFLQYAYRDQNNADVSEIIRKLESNKEFKKAIADGFIVANADTEKVLNGASKIWQFIKSNPYISDDYLNEDITDSRIASIEQWFTDRVAPSFEFIEYLRQNKVTTIELNSISEGRRIEVPREQALPVSKAIGSNHKGKVKLGVMEDSYHISLAGNGINGETSIYFPGRRGSTFIVIPARNGSHAYIHAFPQNVNSTTISKTAKEIKSAIYSEIDRICNGDYASTKEQIQTLEDFLRKVIPSYVGGKLTYNTLFTRQYDSNGINQGLLDIDDNTLKDRKTKNGFRLRFKPSGAQSSVTFINVTINSNLAEVANQIKNAIETCATFNITFSGINSDNRAGGQQHLTRRGSNGEFIVAIPNHEPFVFNSYNDFILDNDLVLATTHPTEDGKSNFERFTGEFESTQQITVRLGDESTPPVREMQTETVTTEISPAPESNAITSVFSNNHIKNKAVKIAEIILGKNFVKEITFSGKKFSILPKNVIFVDENLGENATTNIGTEDATHPNNSNVVVPARSVVVGKEWLAMATSENEYDRKEAVKKLIHEQLHLILHDGNTKYIEQIREIFDEFAAKNTNENLNKYLYKFDEARYYKDGKLNEEGLEEFLVESLTSNELAEGLNAIDSTDTEDKSKKKSLLQRIMEVLAEMLGFDIRKGSLYAKEFKLLRDVLSTPSQIEINLEEDVNTSSTTEEVDLSINEEDLDFFSSIIKEEPYDVYYTQEMKDIKSKAIANGTFMKAPNGKPTNLTERQWLQVRTKAFKEWFGDWEKVAPKKEFKKTLYRGQSAKPIIDSDGNLVLKATYDNLWKGYGLSFANSEEYAEDYGKRSSHSPYIIKIDQDYLDKILPLVEEAGTKGNNIRSIGDEYNEKDREERLLFEGDIKIPKQYYTIEEPLLPISENTYQAGIDYLQAENYFSIADELPFSSTKDKWSFNEIKILYDDFIKRFPNETAARAYLYEIEQNIETVGIIKYEKSFNEYLESEESTDGDVFVKYIGPKPINNVTQSTEVSKVVDENGEPLVVYHNSNADINIFDKNKIGINGSSEGGLFGKGFYFSTNKDYNSIFGNKEYAVFLNIKNPITDERTIKEIQAFKPSIDTIKNVYNKDGLIGTNKFENNTIEYVAYDSNQIKSATDNIGTFSKEDNNIRHSSIRETYFPSTVAFVDRFPISQQATIVEKLDNGEFNIHCK